MNAQPDPHHIKTLLAEIGRLWNAPCHRIVDFIKNPVYANHTFQGIYVVSDPDDNEPIYIGKTNDGDKEKGLADRICGHAAKGSELQNALGIDQTMFERYRVRAVRIDDPVQRGLTELYGISVYRSKANKVARLQALPSYDELITKENRVLTEDSLKYPPTSSATPDTPAGSPVRRG